MAKIVIHSFLTADYIFRDVNRKVCIIGIFDKLNFDDFPAPVPIWFLFSQFSGLEKKGKLQFTLTEAGSDVVWRSPEILVEEKHLTELSKIDVVLPIVNHVFTKPGTSILSLLIDDVEIAQRILSVTEPKGEHDASNTSTDKK